MDTCKCPDREYDETDFGETCGTCGRFRAEDIELAPGDLVIRDQDDGSRPVMPDTFEVVTRVFVDETTSQAHMGLVDAAEKVVRVDFSKRRGREEG